MTTRVTLLLFAPYLLCTSCAPPASERVETSDTKPSDTTTTATPAAPTGLPPAPTYSIGGTVSGLSGSVTLILNGADSLAINGNGPFAFTSSIASGNGYAVEVGTQPSMQTCVVLSGSGIVAHAPVGSIEVKCVFHGALDTQFNTSGITAFADGSNAVATAMAVDAADRIVIAGFVAPSGGTASNVMAVWRVLPNGVLDSSFNGSGRVTMQGAAGTANPADPEYGNDVVIGPSGQIVVAGYGYNGTGDNDVIIWRFLDDGTPDTTFHGSGVVVLGEPSVDDVSAGIALDAQARLVVATNRGGDIVVQRLASDGSEDATFASGASVQLDGCSGHTGTLDAAQDVVIARDGSILLVGKGASDAKMGAALWKLHASGTVDGAFGASGCVFVDRIVGSVATGLVQGMAVADDGNGHILFAGEGLDGANTRAFVLRLSMSGQIDSSFSEGQYLSDTNYQPSSLAIDSSGKIVIGGQRYSATESNSFVMRLMSSGIIDASFGVDGVVSIAAPVSGVFGADRINTVAHDSRGRIVASGFAARASGTSANAALIMRLVP